MTQSCGAAELTAESAERSVHAGLAMAAGAVGASGAGVTAGAVLTPGGATRTGVARGSGSSDRVVTRARVAGRPALYLLASLVVSLLAGSAAPTPLYAIYQRQWGFSPITTTIVFGVYAVAVLAALLTLGRLSDSVGRKPVLLAALGVQVASMLVFATAGGVGELMAARVIQGLATGAALGAIGAGMLDVDRERGALANALSPGLGTGSGALVSALFVQFLPAPTHLIYFALIGVFAAQAIGVALLRETVTRVPVTAVGVRARGPAAARGARTGAGRGAGAVRRLGAGRPVRRARPGAGPVADRVRQRGARRRVADRADRDRGELGLPAPQGLRADRARHRHRRAGGRRGDHARSRSASARSALFFAGTAVSGIGFGAGFQGGIRTVVPQAAPHERAGVLSLLFVVSYLGMGVPAVAAGFGATDGLGLTRLGQGLRHRADRAGRTRPGGPAPDPVISGGRA